MTTPKRRRGINHRDNPPPTEIPGAPPVRAEKRWPQNESARQARGKAGAEGKRPRGHRTDQGAVPA
jgi:hypothetical protein